MKFVRSENVWHLIDENAPKHACVIATLRSDVEVLAMKRLCEHYLADPTRLPEPFSIEHEGGRLSVVPATEPSGKLVLQITDQDGIISKLETEFVVRDR